MANRIVLTFDTAEGLSAEYIVDSSGPSVTFQVGPLGQQDLDVQALLRYLTPAQANTLAAALKGKAREARGRNG